LRFFQSFFVAMNAGVAHDAGTGSRQGLSCLHRLERAFPCYAFLPLGWLSFAVCRVQYEETRMNPTYTLVNWWTRLAALSIGLMLIPTDVFAKAPPIKKGKGDPKSAAKMVDAIVNRNKPPEIVKWPGRFSLKAALFPEDHDWKEDNRAGKAIGRLRRD